MTHPLRVLHAEDDPGVRASLRRLLRRDAHDVIGIGHAREAMLRLYDERFEAAVLDLRFGRDVADESGLDVLRLAVDRGVGRIVVLTGMLDDEVHRRCRVLGADEVIEKQGHCMARVRAALTAPPTSKRHSRLPVTPTGSATLVGSSFAISTVRDLVTRFARLKEPVLILGETGTGKDVVARSIHEAARPGKPFEAVNVAGLTPTLLGSELFGYERGAFTGATERRAGAFERAADGTVFLDEIGDMPLEHQAMLLRILQSKVIQRVGGGTAPLNARVLCATNADLATKMKNGAFRSDLYHRIAALPLPMPALRHRVVDVPELARDIALRRGDRRPLAEDALQWLARHVISGGLTGNVRELENVLTRVEAYRDERSDIELVRDACGYATAGLPARIAIDEADVRRAMEIAEGNVSAAARSLGVSRHRVRTVIRAHK